MIDKQIIIDDMERYAAYDLDHRTWLYNTGLRETHALLYFLKYNKWFGTIQWKK